jgi:predicted ester cyclase
MPRIEHASELTSSSTDAGSRPQRQNARIGERFVAIWDCAAIDVGLAAVDVMFAEKFVNREPLVGPTREDYKSELRMFGAAFPNLLAVAQAIIAEGSGNRVVVRWTATGTYAGGLGFVGVNDALAVGRTVTLKGIDILRIERGKIAERWGQFDGLGMVRQLTP